MGRSARGVRCNHAPERKNAPQKIRESCRDSSRVAQGPGRQPDKLFTNFLIPFYCKSKKARSEDENARIAASLFEALEDQARTVAESEFGKPTVTALIKMCRNDVPKEKELSPDAALSLLESMMRFEWALSKLEGGSFPTETLELIRRIKKIQSIEGK